MKTLQLFIDKKWWVKLCAVATLLFTALALTAAQTNAQSNQNRNALGDNLKISPLRTDTSAEPGQTVKVPVYIQNMDRGPVTLRVINNDFVAGDNESGEPSVILDEDKFAPTHSLKRFMQPIGDIKLAAGERRQVNAVIKVPSDAMSGGYFGALRFTKAGAGNLPEDANVSLAGGVTSLILLTVPGDVTEKLLVKDFAIQQNGKSSTRFGSPDDIQAVLRLENKGNIQLAPFGEVFVQKGDKIVHQAKFNNITPAGVILPDSVRKWSVPVKNLKTFGKYKISTTFGYGGNGESMTIEKTIWIIPTSYIIGAIIGIIAIVGLIALTVSSLKAYKKKILRGARRR